MFLQLLTFHRISAPYVYGSGSSFQAGSASFILFFMSGDRFPEAVQPFSPSTGTPGSVRTISGVS